MSPEFEWQLIVAGTVLLLAATLVQLTALARRRDGYKPTAIIYAATATVFGIAIAGRWVREGQGPFMTMYEILLSSVFSLCLIFLVVSAAMAVARAGAFVVSPLLLMLCLWLVNESAAATPLPGSFDNPWLWAHVLSGKVFLGFCMAATALAVAMLLRGMLSAGRFARLDAAPEEAEQSIWTLFFVAFICHSFMLVAGSVWAHSAWGRYWSWDSLETWTLVTWLALGGLLHARATFKNMPAGLGHALVVGVFALAFLTFFGVPFLSIAPHKGLM
ncbi:MAG: cytochrome c biogenesis protein CcsA [Gammaproteobacteria bacterium]|nr:cytochrome c biogenesis protein CcsA [Gammaproteobacteria bacterium]